MITKQHRKPISLVAAALAGLLVGPGAGGCAGAGAGGDGALPYETNSARQERERARRVGKLVAEAEARVAAGDLDGGRASYREALELDGSAVAPRLGLAALEMKAHRYGEAERWLREVIALQPDDARPRFLLVSVLLRQRRVEDARKEFQAATSMSGGDERTELRLKATIALRAGQVLQAARLFDDYIASWPDDPAGWVGLGVALLVAGHPDDGLQALRRAEKLAPASAIVHYNLALGHYRAGDLDAAIAHGQRAMELDPLFLPAQLNLATALYGRGRYADAEAILRHALTIRPGYAPAYNNLGVVLLAAEDIDGAAEAFAKAAHHAPRAAAFHFNLGLARFRQGRLPEARSAFEMVVALDPRDASARANLTWLDGKQAGTINGTQLPARASKYAVDDYDE